MDKSDFDIVKCPLEKCPFYHLMLCEGYKTEKEAEINMEMFIEIHNRNTKERIVYMSKFDKNNPRHRDPNLCDNCAFGKCRFGLGNSICNLLWCLCECQKMEKKET